jgi:phosphatidyl-myo-inositol dimannoside synthase
MFTGTTHRVWRIEVPPRTSAGATTAVDGERHVSANAPASVSRPLFITRKFPPSVGGMQTLAAGVWDALERGAPGARLIAHGGTNRGLAAWLVHALPRAIWALARGRVDSVLTGDALMYALCRPFLAASGVANATMVMGLDVTYSNRIYQVLVGPALRRAPRVIAISHATAEAAIARGVSPDRVSVVRLGIHAPEVGPERRQQAAESLRHRFAIGTDDVVMLTLGRLVRRKGVHWFVRKVFPRLPSNVTYLVAGDGPDAGEVRRSVIDLRLEERVHMLGAVDDSDRERLLRGADLFVQPNIPVPGDMEGFGLVILEAAMRDTAIVASGIEGIRDAVIDGQTGILLPSEREDAWVERLTELVAAPADLRRLGAKFGHASRQLYGAEQMSRQMIRLLAEATP